MSKYWQGYTAEEIKQFSDESIRKQIYNMAKSQLSWSRSDNPNKELKINFLAKEIKKLSAELDSRAESQRE